MFNNDNYKYYSFFSFYMVVIDKETPTSSKGMSRTYLVKYSAKVKMSVISVSCTLYPVDVDV